MYFHLSLTKYSPAFVEWNYILYFLLCQVFSAFFSISSQSFFIALNKPLNYGNYSQIYANPTFGLMQILIFSSQLSSLHKAIFVVFVKGFYVLYKISKKLL